MMQGYKTPAEIKDYTIDWTCSLATAEQINSSSWSISNVNGDNALVIAEQVINAGDLTTTVWLSGGTAGQVYTVTNTVITDNSPSREFQQSFSCIVNATNNI